MFYKMSSRSRSRLSLRKQNRFFCGHCNEYLLRATFWRHRKAYYDVQNERWMTRDDAESDEIGNGNEREAKRTRCRSSVNDNLEYDKETTARTGDAEEWPYSSEEESLDEALSHDHEGMDFTRYTLTFV